MNDPIIIIIDIEPDEFFVDPCRREPWVGFELAVPYFENLRKRLRDSTGKSVNFTWMLRLDPQVEITYSDPAWPINSYRKQIDRLISAGDEIGIHVHAYRRQNSAMHWVEDYGNQEWVNLCIDMAFETYCEKIGKPPRVFSMGADWISNDTILHAANLGLIVDTTLVARAKWPFEQSEFYTGTMPDLSQVEPVPYRPSSEDYRVSDDPQLKGFHILPLTPLNQENAFEYFGNRLLSRILRRPHRLNNRSSKIFPDSPTSDIRWQLRHLGYDEGNSYLTFSLATRKFTNPESLRLMNRNFELLCSHKHSKNWRITNPVEAIKQISVL